MQINLFLMSKLLDVVLKLTTNLCDRKALDSTLENTTFCHSLESGGNIQTKLSSLRWPGKDVDFFFFFFFYPRLFIFIRDFFLFATSFFIHDLYFIHAFFSRDFFVQTRAHVMPSAISSDSYKKVVVGLHRLLAYVFVCRLDFRHSRVRSLFLPEKRLFGGEARAHFPNSGW